MEKRLFLASLLVLALILASGCGTQTEGDFMSKLENEGEWLELEEGLRISDIIVGEGDEVKSGDKISAHYTLWLTDGTMLQTSKDRGPFSTFIGVGDVISGWDKGIPGMKAGGTRKLIIAADLAYGNQDKPGIPPGSTLVFEVDVLEILQ